jgi:outer membrane translocation and assembly module TamA
MRCSSASPADPPLRSGERLSHATYEQYKRQPERAAATYGYLDARMLRSEMQVDPARTSANIFLQLDSGERYYFGATTIEQNAVRDERGAPFPALPRGRALQRAAAAAHAVRAR